MSSTRNKTIKLTDETLLEFEKKLIKYKLKKEFIKINDVKNRTINGDSINILKRLPDASVNLIVVDPPLILSKY